MILVLLTIFAAAIFDMGHVIGGLIVGRLTRHD